jgi:hypothetical protein
LVDLLCFDRRVCLRAGQANMPPKTLKPLSAQVSTHCTRQRPPRANQLLQPTFDMSSFFAAPAPPLSKASASVPKALKPVKKEKEAAAVSATVKGKEVERGRSSRWHLSQLELNLSVQSTRLDQKDCCG